ncbi:Protein FRA10AC1 [Trametes pubescens]|uniref:Protein FRA10AC1 n=1 Tax=Trametes pubescens TaxID=154538 RepID=A0A1M2W5S7_TRAPU|nr:Protein FRA10AC1 [Trametes pubescens]
MALSSRGAGPSFQGNTEFDILKSSHKFLREDDDVDERQLSWDDRLAKKYYSALYREYAVCDLKHYKTGNFALRWRTEEEVLAGAGETTCGNTRCRVHREFPEKGDDIRPSLTTLELPFSYLEHGESKFALVKVVLCPKCLKKLMYKRNKEKEEARKRQENPGDNDAERDVENGHRKRSRSHERRKDDDEGPYRRHRSAEHDDQGRSGKRRRHSRSHSPRRKDHDRGGASS